MFADGQPFGERREVGDTFLITVQFPSGVMLFLASGTANERGIKIHSIDIREPNLEAVFLHLTGRALRD